MTDVANFFIDLFIDKGCFRLSMVNHFCKPPRTRKQRNQAHKLALITAKCAKTNNLYEKIRRFEHSKIYRYEKVRYWVF